MSTLAEEVLTYLPMTADRSAWYAGIGGLALALVVMLALYGAVAACRGRHPPAPAG